MFGLFIGSRAGSFSVLSDPRRLNMMTRVQMLINISMIIKSVFFCRVIRKRDELICRDLKNEMRYYKYLTIIIDNEYTSSIELATQTSASSGIYSLRYLDLDCQR